MEVSILKWLTPEMYWTPLLHESNIQTSGENLYWRKSYNCPCASFNNGQADPACKSCFGLGYAYEASTGPYSGVLAFNYPVEPGMQLDKEQGGIETGNPYLVVAPDQAPLYTNLSAYDMIIEENSTTTYHVGLSVGRRETLPFAYSASVSAVSAVRIYDPVAKEAKFIPYTVNGATVTVSGYPEGTGYVVTYTANQAYIAYGSGAYPHPRPFHNTLNMPRRVQLERLDMWLRKIPVG